MSKPLLHISNLSTGWSSRSRESRELHSGLELSLETGKLLLLVGRNGIGKSALLRTLAGLQDPLKGQVKVQGQALDLIDPKFRASLVSLVLASPPQNLRLSVLEVILSGRFRFSGQGAAHYKTDRPIALSHMERVGLNLEAHTPFDRLSDGEKQKVMLARCLAQDTPLLLLDEPLAFLDYPSRKSFLNTLAELCRDSGKSAVYSSHDIALSLEHCHSVLHLKQGSHELIHEPQTLRGDDWMLDD
ncbi:MAG: ABC transporter ATP-binding protein [Bacteroidia bacterium]